MLTHYYNILTKYRILAFATCIKNRRRNSFIYAKESKQKIAADLDISINTFKKYLSICKEMGFVTEYGDGDFQLCGLVEIIQTLDCGIDKLCYFNAIAENNTFKEIYNSIVQSILLKNFIQQGFCIDKKEKNKGRNCTKKVKGWTKKARELGISTDEYIRKIIKPSKKEIVSGRFHASTKIKMSPYKGRDVLVKMNQKKVIHRKKVFFEYLDKSNEMAFLRTVDRDAYLSNLKSIYNAPNPIYKQSTIIETFNNFFISKGSQITILNSYDITCSKLRENTKQPRVVYEN